MNMIKNEAGNLLLMTVCEGVTVNILPNEQYEYLMTTKEVANGYGTTVYAIRKALLRNSAEFIESKHVLTEETICPRDYHMPHNSVFWTKRGIVRLGFFIKSERAKLFRDWAEELIIKVDEQKDLFGASAPLSHRIGNKTKANRLTSERLLGIMADVCLIDDKELRLRISSKLMKGGAL